MRALILLALLACGRLAQLPAGDAERAALGRAVQAQVPDAAGWELRAIDEGGFRERPEDRAVFVDLPPVPLEGRVLEHESLRCFRSPGWTEWVCDQRQTLIAVAPPLDFDPEANSCPGEERGIRLGDGVSAEVLPELTDYVRFGRWWRDRYHRLCEWPRDARQLLLPEACDVDAGTRTGDTTFQISLRMRTYSWLVVDVARECGGAEGCSIKYVGCSWFDY